jgi:putative aldouronate transport system permease protein
MSVGGVLGAGFDQIFNLTGSLHNGRVMDSVQIIDTLIYQYTFQTKTITEGQATAVGMFKSVVGFILVIITDRIAKACGERGII